MGGTSFGRPTLAQLQFDPPTIRVRVRVTVRTVGAWTECRVQLKHQLHMEGWLDVTHPDRPVLVARQPARAGDAPDAGVRLLVLKVLGGQVQATVVGQPEQRRGDHVDEWHYWVDLSHPVGVLLHTQPDGTVLVLGM